MVLPVNLFKNSLILVWCFYINLHAEISEPLQHYLFRLFLIRSSTTRESLLGASSFYLILFSTVCERDVYLKFPINNLATEKLLRSGHNQNE
jgi:hypothetical protein